MLFQNNLAVTTIRPEGNHTHKRSNSLTNTIQVLKPPTPLSPHSLQPLSLLLLLLFPQVIPQTASAGYSRFSVEDLNQEVSSALEGKSLLFEVGIIIT